MNRATPRTISRRGSQQKTGIQFEGWRWVTIRSRRLLWRDLVQDDSDMTRSRILNTKSSRLTIKTVGASPIFGRLHKIIEAHLDCPCLTSFPTTRLISAIAKGSFYRRYYRAQQMIKRKAINCYLDHFISHKPDIYLAGIFSCKSMSQGDLTDHNIQGVPSRLCSKVTTSIMPGLCKIWSEILDLILWKSNN